MAAPADTIRRRTTDLRDGVRGSVTGCALETRLADLHCNKRHGLGAKAGDNRRVLFIAGYLHLLVLGVLAIYAAERTVRWMHRRGWVHWKPRGTSSALGNAVMQVQIFYQPQIREVLEQRLQEEDQAEESGDPPSDWFDDADEDDGGSRPGEGGGRAR